LERELSTAPSRQCRTCKRVAARVRVRVAQLVRCDCLCAFGLGLRRRLRPGSGLGLRLALRLGLRLRAEASGIGPSSQALCQRRTGDTVSTTRIPSPPTARAACTQRRSSSAHSGTPHSARSNCARLLVQVGPHWKPPVEAGKGARPAAGPIWLAALTTQTPEGIPGEAAGKEVPTERLLISGRAAAYGSWPRPARRARSPTCADPSAPAHASPRWRPRDGSPQRTKAARRALRAAPARSGASGRGEGGPATCFRPGSARTPERHEEAGRAAKLRVACGERLGHRRLAAGARRVCD
jgi:hypothetical protein